MRLVPTLVAVFLLLPPAAPNNSARMLDTPFGPAKALVAPDGHHALWGDEAKSQLWMEDTATHTDRLVQPLTVQTISLAWSPDSRHFVVNDRETSSESDAYLFDTDTLQRTKLRDRLTAARPEVQHYLLSDKPGPGRSQVAHGRDVMHSYLDVRRWIDDRHVELQLHGNFAGRFRDDHPDGHLYPAGCFDLRFRMGLDGSVQRLSEHIAEPLSNSSACGWGPHDSW
jgi:hypothetical protein